MSTQLSACVLSRPRLGATVRGCSRPPIKTSDGSFGGAKVPARLAVAKALDGGHALNGIGKCTRCHKEHKVKRTLLAHGIAVKVVDVIEGICI